MLAASAGAAVVAVLVSLLETKKNRDPGGLPMSSEEKTFQPVKKAPTLEEVSAWAQSFDKLMLTPAGRNAFREFLRTEFSEENMLFWMACEELKKEANKNIIEEKARIIYEDYVSILSPKEVSLDSRVREVINRNMVEPSQHIFDDAQLQIYTLMHRDSYPRFMNSALYKDLLQSLSEKSVEA
ncbi:regulator of G-protein signaling 20 isoform X3 [Equus asinus]